MVAVDPCIMVWEPICPDGFPENPTAEQQEMIDDAVEAATEVMYNRTKRRFGTCTVTYRPCKDECLSFGGWPWYAAAGWNNATDWAWPFPALVGGNWINLACGSCSNGCSCTTIERVLLPYPVYEIESVKVDGVILDPSSYFVNNRRELIRIDGGTWPTCNDLSLNDDEVGTWSVTALYGEPVPMLGRLAVGQLASQIYKVCAGGEGCTLPSGVVKEVNRQGVRKVFFDAETAFKGGRVGLYYPDLFISTYNPSGTGLASIFNIDGPRRQFTSSS